MKQENYRNKRKINRLTTALLGIFFYILVVLLLKSIQNAFTPGSGGMLVFNCVELVIITLYLIGYTWYNFRNASQESNQSFWKYLILIMIPFVVMTVITIIVTYAGGADSFSPIWNRVTFVIAPTLYCFIPYGILFKLIPAMPVALFMILCLAYMVLMQFLGYVLGASSRKYAKEREEKRYEMEQAVLQQQDKMAQKAYEARVRKEQLRKEQSAKERIQRSAYVDENDPLKDVVSPPVIETEAFSMITDEMIAEAVKHQRIKSSEEKIAAIKARQAQKSSAQSKAQVMDQTIPDQEQASPSQHPELDELKQMTRDLEAQLELARKRLETKGQ